MSKRLQGKGGLWVRMRVTRRWPAVMVASVLEGRIVKGALGVLRTTVWIVACVSVVVFVEVGFVLECLVLVCGGSVGASDLHGVFISVSMGSWVGAELSPLRGVVSLLGARS